MKILIDERRCVGADLPAWMALGGGTGLERALADPAGIIPAIEAAGLRGLGGAGFPTHRKWAAVAAQPGPGKWVVCNGNEDEPGTFKDRFLLSRTPHQVIEGALVAALAVKAANIVLYINPREAAAVRVLREAVTQWEAHRLFARLATAIGEELHLLVVTGSGLYIGGEETAAVASVMGGFPFPTLKPPFPAETGVNGAPTLVNNVETLAHAGQILGHGPEWYRSLGLGGAPGTKLFSLSGDVLRPGLHELPMGTSLRSLVFEHGGGMLAGKAFKAVFTGGPSNTLLTAADLDVPLDFDSLRARGSRLGTGAMIVVGEGTSILRKTAEYVTFFANNSCGQCPPCKIGTHQVSRILERIEAGAGRPDDLRALENLTELLPGSGRCGLVDGAATVLASSLKTFRAEYEQALRPGEKR
ncbi:NADH-ubiquinone oxidoreductase-F iron-sulfur binding region domain-containing protein [Roseomonas xinghualingensis]|uniref:NADH-ubiquinone oxidoreductase-F iron-sulfur binding region domain-containing protein n=1 Tax=Roseomonas xinghualingensis TaxID=2986475 RepID=UPI0021F1FE5B|nr:NADH-ubiquinone oxidoreductase-F iron-sulfur binding region domain-containing protein [Roseomonas sp. SXEYE001]MCV4209945.1 SLBB domain-containing protein [Roseomonas sp. SXEYE001]